jgi:putative flippase GtrA
MRDSTFGRFLAVGIANTAVGYGVILGLQYFAGFGPLAANAGGYLVGWALSYLLNRRFTFASNRPHQEGLPLFLATALVSYGLNVLVLELAIRFAGVPDAVAQALAMGAYTLCFYQLSRHVTFKHRAE